MSTRVRSKNNIYNVKCNLLNYLLILAFKAKGHRPVRHRAQDKPPPLRCLGPFSFFLSGESTDGKKEREPIYLLQQFLDIVYLRFSLNKSTNENQIIFDWILLLALTSAAWLPWRCRCCRCRFDQQEATLWPLSEKGGVLLDTPDEDRNYCSSVIRPYRWWS
jgi:hypothetical protein